MNELTALRALAETGRQLRLTPAASAHFPLVLQAFDDALVRALKIGKAEPAFDFESHLRRQREWSAATFGPAARTRGVVDHIRKELTEIEAAPGDLSEWIDVVILALDGAWRAGHSPNAITAALQAKQAKNESRTWPDWRTADPDKAIEHDRSAEGRPSVAPLAIADVALSRAVLAKPVDVGADWPRDPANGRLLCTAKRPRPFGAAGQWAHEGGFVVHAGDTSDACACRDCGQDWNQELPE